MSRFSRREFLGGALAIAAGITGHRLRLEPTPPPTLTEWISAAQPAPQTAADLAALLQLPIDYAQKYFTALAASDGTRLGYTFEPPEYVSPGGPPPQPPVQLIRDFGYHYFSPPLTNVVVEKALVNPDFLPHSDDQDPELPLIKYLTNGYTVVVIGSRPFSVMYQPGSVFEWQKLMWFNYQQVGEPLQYHHHQFYLREKPLPLVPPRVNL